MVATRRQSAGKNAPLDVFNICRATSLVTIEGYCSVPVFFHGVSCRIPWILPGRTVNIGNWVEAH